MITVIEKKGDDEVWVYWDNMRWDDRIADVMMKANFI